MFSHFYIEMLKGIIGCISRSSIDEWYSSNQTTKTINRYSDINFREAVRKANKAGHSYLLFSPDGGLMKDYQAPCPTGGWIHRQEQHKCLPPQTYEPPNNCNIYITVGQNNRVGYEKQCGVQWPSYPKGTAWSTTELPPYLINAILPPNNENDCSIAQPIYVYALPFGDGVLQACLDDRTSFPDCFIASSVQFLNQRVQFYKEQQKSSSQQVKQLELQKQAIESNQTMGEIQAQNDKKIQNTQRQQTQQIQNQVKQQQNTIQSNLQNIQATNVEQNQFNEFIQRKRFENQLQIQNSSQHIYLQNQRWKMTKRMQEITEQYYHVIYIVFGIVFMLFIAGAVLFYRYGYHFF